MMGKKTVFSHDSAERKDLDVVQVFVNLQADFRAPLGLRLDADISVPTEQRTTIL